MRIGASSIHTYSSGSNQSQDTLRQEQIQQAIREQDKTRQLEQAASQQQDNQNTDTARRVAQQREVVSVDKPAKSQPNYQYYPFPNNNGLSASQQRALQTYSNNQDLSRTDNSGDFLGSVDVFA